MVRYRAPRAMVDRLMAPDMWTGWGIRTLSANHPACGEHANSGWCKERSFSGVDVGGGRKIYLECRGPRARLSFSRQACAIAPIFGATSPNAEAVFPAVAAFTRVCAHDRPGTTLGTDQFSRNDPVPMPRTAEDAVTDLHALLQGSSNSCPLARTGHDESNIAQLGIGITQSSPCPLPHELGKSGATPRRRVAFRCFLPLLSDYSESQAPPLRLPGFRPHGHFPIHHAQRRIHTLANKRSLYLRRRNILRTLQSG
jgi:hypothetical protein